MAIAIAANGQEGPADGHHEQSTENRDRPRFAQSAVRDENAKVQPGQDTDERSRQEDATGPPMKPNMAGSNPGGKLKRRDQEKDTAWKNVQQCQERVGGEPAIDTSQLCWPLQRKRIVSMKSIHKPLPQRVSTREGILNKDGSADGRSQSDYDEQHSDSPQGTNQRARWHAACGVVGLHRVPGLPRQHG
jgi:hypothetical protein